MAHPHLTYTWFDGGDLLAKHRLNAISGSGGDHLVIVRQKNSWSNKILRVTPTESKFVMAYAYGQENVSTDVSTLASNLANQLYAASWNTGAKALFFCYSRGQSLKRMADDEPDYADYSEFSASAIALKFNLRHINLNSPASVTPYLRAYCPSLMLYDNANIQYATAPAAFSNTLATTMEYRFYEELPANVGGVGGNDTNRLNLYGTSNNGAAAGTVVADPLKYTPYGYHGSFSVDMKSAIHPGWASASTKYHDYEITSNYNTSTHATEAGKRFFTALNRAYGDIWLVVRPRIFTSAVASYDTLMGYIQRIELVFKITSTSFNL